MPHRSALLKLPGPCTDHAEGRARLPLVFAILRELEERSHDLLLLEAALAALGGGPTDAAARRLHEQEASLQRREMARAELELARIGCSVVVSRPLTIHMCLPDGSEMSWIIGRA